MDDYATDGVRLLELDGVPSRVQTAPAAPRAVPGVTVLPAAEKLARAEEQAAAAAGIVWKEPTFYANGTAMEAQGEERARQLRAEWEARPLTAEACLALQDTITAESRRDSTVRLAEFSIDGTGLLTRGAAGRLRLTDRAFQQIASYAPAGATRYNLNSWRSRIDPTEELKFRTRYPDKASGTRELFAAVTPKYTAFDVDRVAAIVARRAPAGTRAAVKYDGERATIDLSLAATFDVPGEIGVGRVHRAGIRVSTADDGSASVAAELYAERIRCINCTILQGVGARFRRRHVGTEQGLARLLSQAMHAMTPAVEEFRRVWGQAGEAVYSDATSGDALSARETFARFVATDTLHVPYETRAGLFSALVDAHAYEPGETVAAVNRAITRVAHTGSWRSPWYTEELEQTAGELLYARHYRLAPLSDERRELLTA